ncbi:MAG: hypothetical protein N2491_08730 [Negativicutes bacterium]|nr:hypothetical protein [Negativicutes bacterium]
MTLKYAIYGLCFGWLLMPRWKSRKWKIPMPVMAYGAAVIVSLSVAYYLDFSQAAWSFVIGMSAQLAVFAVAKWMRHGFRIWDRRIRR